MGGNWSAERGVKRSHVNTEEKETLEDDLSDSSSDLHTPKRKRFQSTAQYIVRTLFEEGRDSDVTIHALGTAWHLHRVYLSQCKYFDSMFNGQWAESHQPEIHITVTDDNIDKEALLIAFKSLYTDSILVKPVQVIGVLAAAAFLQLEPLIEHCRTVMKGCIMCNTVCSFLVASECYGLMDIKDLCMNWLLRCLMLPRNALMLSDIGEELLALLLDSRDLWITQVEVDIYCLVKKWVFIQLNPLWNGSKEQLSKDTSDFFKQRAKNNGLHFLETVEGHCFIPLFGKVRWMYIVNDSSCLQSVQDDQIVPFGWLDPVFRFCWTRHLRVEQGLDVGPREVKEEDFFQCAMRCGRVLLQEQEYHWRWLGYSYGLDLLFTLRNKVLTVSRNCGSTQRFAGSLSQQEMRNIMLRVKVTPIRKKEMGPVICTGIKTLSLGTDDAECVLLTLNIGVTFPVQVTMQLLYLTPDPSLPLPSLAVPPPHVGSVPTSPPTLLADMSTQSAGDGEGEGGPLPPVVWTQSGEEGDRHGGRNTSLQTSANGILPADTSVGVTTPTSSETLKNTPLSHTPCTSLGSSLTWRQSSAVSLSSCAEESSSAVSAGTHEASPCSSSLKTTRPPMSCLVLHSDNTSTHYQSAVSTSAHHLSAVNTSAHHLSDVNTSAHHLSSDTSAHHLSSDSTSAHHLSSDSTSTHHLSAVNTSAYHLSAVNTSTHHLSAVNTSAHHLSAVNTSAHHLSSSTSAHHLSSDSTSAHHLSSDSTSAHHLSSDSTSAHHLSSDSTSAHHISSDSTSAHHLSAVNTSAHHLSAVNTSAHHLSSDTSAHHLSAVNTSAHHLSAVNTSAHHLSSDTSAHHLSAVNISAHHLSSDSTSAHHLPSDSTSAHHLSSVSSSAHHISPDNTSAHHLSSANTAVHPISSVSNSAHHLSSDNTSAHHLSSDNTSAHHLSSVNTSAQHLSPVSTSAHHLSSVNTSAQNLSPVNTSAHHLSPVNTSAHHLSSDNTSAHHLSSVNTSAQHLSPVSTSAQNLSPVNTSAHHLSSVNTSAQHLSAVNTSAHHLSSVNTSAHHLSAVNTSAQHLSAVNTLGQHLSVVNFSAQHLSDAQTLGSHSADRSVALYGVEGPPSPLASSSLGSCVSVKTSGSHGQPPPKPSAQGPQVARQECQVVIQERHVAKDRNQVATQIRQVATQECEVATEGHQVATQGRQMATQEHQVATQGRQVATQGRQVVTQGCQVATHEHQVATQGRQVTTQGCQVATEGRQVRRSVRLIFRSRNSMK